MKASILAIGTELTTGQILNKNACTLSARLKALGIEVTSHLTVPDNKDLILGALRFLEAGNRLLFVTGGLGPTSDDFTRDVVAEWAGARMAFDEASWKYINERLTGRGFQVREMQRQQCFFPEQSDILFNTQGTAHGFKLETRGLQVFVLPGPPREIDAIWKDHVAPDLEEQTRELPRIITRAWDTLGAGESDVAFQVEEILKDRPAGVPLDIGYRAHLPYVEVKLTFSGADSKTWEPYLKKIEERLSEITYARDGADVLDRVTAKIHALDFTFYDFLSEGVLHARLAPALKSLKNWSFKQSGNAPAVDLFENEDNFAALLPFEEGQCVLLWSVEGRRRQQVIEAPMKSASMGERRRQYFTEMFLVHLSQ